MSGTIMEAFMNTAMAYLKEDQFDWVHDSQQTFRILMTAIAFPGTIQQLKSAAISFSNPDLGYILHPMLTLLDHETTFCVVCRDADLNGKVTHYIELNTSSKKRELSQADFILCLDGSLGGRFEELKKGTLAQPDKSATIFYLLNSLDAIPDVNAIQFSLTGPGIKYFQTVYASGLAPGEL
jgi:phosphonate C-P lyase system protein PhnH